MEKKANNEPKNKSNFRKQIKINYSRSEFIKKYKHHTINNNMFKDLIVPFLNYFEIHKKDLKRNNAEELEYEIQYDIADLLCVMMKNFKENPLYDRRECNDNITSSAISQYNNNIINDIDNLPDYLKFFIKNNENYKYNYTLAKFIPILLDRLSLLFATIALHSNSNSGNVLLDLISSIDQWTDNYFTHSSELDYYKNNKIPVFNFGSLNQPNAQNDLGYSIDNILKESFKLFHRETNSKFDNNMPNELLEYIINSSKEDATEDEVRNNYTTYLNSVYTSPELLKNQLDHYKNLQKLIDNSQDILTPEYFIENKQSYIRFCKNELNKFLIEYQLGGSINRNIDSRNVARFIEELNSCDHNNLERTIIKFARELYALKLEEVKLKYELYKSIKDKKTNNGLKPIREHLDSALGQTLLLVLNKEYKFSNSIKEKNK